MMHRFFREPLVHFALIAGVVLTGYQVLAPVPAATPERIAISRPKVDQLVANFQRAWQRTPSDTELAGLVDELALDEMFYREAVALGLDKEDDVIRRRLRTKLEILIQSEVDSRAASDTELEAFLKAHPEKFGIEPGIALQHVFFDPAQRGARTQPDAETALAELLKRPDANPDQFGDPMLLIPPDVPMSFGPALDQMFGGDLPAKALQYPVGIWAGPVASAFGIHLVRVISRESGRLPPLADVRQAVTREWRYAQRQTAEASVKERLRKRYSVAIDHPTLAPPK